MNTDNRQMPLAFPFRRDSTFTGFLAEDANAPMLYTLQHLEAESRFPVYLWGDPGCGRTHLLQAMCQQTPDSVYLPVAELKAHTPEVLAGLENLSLVCVDDVHLLAGENAWQEGFFRLFNALQQNSGYMVVTADRPAAALQLELADLVSRLQWGLVFQVRALSDGGKAEVLQSAAGHRGIELDDDLVNYILTRAERRMDKLFDLLDRLDALSLIEKRRITQPFIKQMMGW